MSVPNAAVETRPSLLLSVRNPSDAEAWRTFVDVYTPLIYGYCRHKRLQEADAADVTQEVLAKVARAIRKFEYSPERGRFRDWLGVVTRGELIRYMSRSGRQLPPGQDLSTTNVESAPDSAWLEQFHAHVLEISLNRIRTSFEPTTWRAFELVWLEERGARETSKELGEPIESVYVAKSRVLKRLREEVMMIAEDLPSLERGGS